MMLAEEVHSLTVELDRLLQKKINSPKDQLLAFIANSRVSLSQLANKESLTSAARQTLKSIRDKIKVYANSQSSAASGSYSQNVFLGANIKGGLKDQVYAEIVKRDDIIAALQRETKSKSKMLEQNEQKLEQAEKRNRLLQGKLEEMEFQCRRVKDTVEVEQTANLENQKRLASIQHLIAQQNQEKAALRARLAQLQQRNRQLEQRKREESSIEDRLAAAFDQCDVKALNYEAVRAELQQVEKLNSQLQSSCQLAKTQANELRIRNVQLETLVKQQQLQLAASNLSNFETVALKEAEIQKVQAELASCKDKRGAAEQRANRTESMNEILRSQLDLARSKQQSRASECERLIRQKQHLKAKLKQQTQKLAAFREEFDRLSVEYSRATYEVGRLKSQAHELSQLLKEQKINNRNLVQSLSRCKEQLAKTQNASKQNSNALLQQQGVCLSQNEHLAKTNFQLSQRLAQLQQAKERYKSKYLNVKNGLQRLLSEKHELEQLFRDQLRAHSD